MKNNDAKDFIFICYGKDCKKQGCKKMKKNIEKELKSRSFGRKFKIIKTKCTDHCGQAPVMIINNNLIKKATTNQALKLIDSK